jgi:phospholipase/lecithinase/hemolysin
MSEEESGKLWMNKAFCRTADGFADAASMARGLAMFNERTRAVAHEYSISLLDLEAAIPKKMKYFSDDVHYTVAGNRLAAERIAEFLLTNSILERLTSVDRAGEIHP